MPISVIVNETSTVDIKLEHCLESPVNLLEVIRIAFNLDNLNSFVNHLVVSVVRLPSRLLFQKARRLFGIVKFINWNFAL